MKVRSSHIVVVVLALVALVVGAAVLRKNGAGGSGDTTQTDAFLQQIQQEREQGRGSSETAGIIPSSEIDIAKTPRIEFAAKEVDLGVIHRNGKASGKVGVRNTGAMPLEITEVRTSCGCTMGSFKLKSVRADGKELTTIPPGQEMDLDITVDPALVHGFHSRKTLTLFNNDPVHPQASIDVSASVDPEYTMEPDKFDFGIVQQGETPEVHAIIRQTGDEPLEIKALQLGDYAEKLAKSNDGSGLYSIDAVKRAETVWKTPGKPEWDVTAKLAPTAPTGEFFDQFRVLSNLPRVAEVDFEIVGKIESFYEIDPKSLGARNAVSPGQKDVASAHITAKVPIQILDPTVTGTDLQISVSQGASPNEADIHLDVSPTAKPGLKSESVSFSVKGPERTVKQTMRAYASVQDNAPAAQ